MTEREKRAERAAQRQLDAYNAHDIEAFVACYHADIELFDLRSGESRGRGRAQMRETYAASFKRCPELHAEVTTRSVIDNVAFDKEFVTGLGDEPVHAMAVYEVDDDELITRAWFVVAPSP